MKTKKDDKQEDEPAGESGGKTRARKRHNADEDEKAQDKTDPQPAKRRLVRPALPKRPLGITKTLRSKKTLVTKDKVKAIAKPSCSKVGRPALKRTTHIKSEPKSPKEDKSLIIPPSEIKKEPEEVAGGSRSSSPKTAPRRQRLTSDIQMMRSTLAESPTSLLLGSRTSPYSTRSERSNSPFRAEPARGSRRGKLKNNLLSEIVRNEQKKRRLESEGSKTDASPDTEEAKNLKRRHSVSQDGSEISAAESDLSLCEAVELEKEVKTEVDIEEETSTIQPDICKVPFAVECKSEGTGTSFNLVDNKLDGLKRSTSLDSDNNNRMKVDEVQTRAEDKAGIDLKINEKDTILTNMSKTFNTKEMTKNIRKARRGRKVIAANRDKKQDKFPQEQANDDSFMKEINDLISTLEDSDVLEDSHKVLTETPPSITTESNVLSPDTNTKTVTKFYGLQTDNIRTISEKTVIPEKNMTPVISQKIIVTETLDPVLTPVKSQKSTVNETLDPVLAKEIEDGENIRLQISDEESQDKTDEDTKENVKTPTTFKPTTPSIDKLMDKLKHFEELDKKRQQEQKAKESVMVTDDVVLIPKSGSDIKPLKGIQATISVDKLFDKSGSVLSCFQNNSAISIVTKRDQVRKSMEVDLPNSITLIKRNASTRKESTSSNSGDTLSILSSASLGKDVTLTELRRSVDKAVIPTSIENAQTLHSLATITPNKPGTVPQSIANLGTSLSIIAKDDLPKTNASGNRKIVLKRDRHSFNSESSEKIQPDGVNSMTAKIKSLPDTSIKTPTTDVMKSCTTEVMKSPAPEVIKSPKSCATEAIKSPKTDVNKAPKSFTTEIIKSPTPEVMKSSIMEVIKCPSTAVIKSPTTEVIKSPISEVIKSPTSELTNKSCLKSILSPTKEVKPIESNMMNKVDTMTIANITSTDSPNEVVMTALKDEAVIPQVKVKIDAIIADAPVAKENSETGTITVKIPPDVLKECVPSPRETKTKSPLKSSTSPKEKLPLPKCGEPVAGPSSIVESPERQKRKESILRTLGLLTLKAADEAKIEKQKQKEMYATKNNKAGKMSSSGESSGTLRTVIKLKGLNSEKKGKSRSPLKMTFQKAKCRAGKPSLEAGDIEADEYYTIHKEGGTSVSASNATGGHRKTHYRLNNNDGNGAYHPSTSPEPVPLKDTPNLVIPEKASSFSIHPGRLCQDQCFYCGGNFGLFDTPCHIAQMKSAERQKKVLDNEEKLTMDSCLCDACYRHVDRRANCPSYRNRPALAHNLQSKQLHQSTMEAVDGQQASAGDKDKPGAARQASCHAEGCKEVADHSIRRKWLIKMRNSVNRVVKLQLDYPGLHTIPLCAAHYAPVSRLMVCSLCRRRLTKHHNIHFVNHGLEELNPRLAEQGLPVRFAERPAVCKLCRYYCTLLCRPQQQQNKKHFLKLHRRRLLQTYNIDLPEDSEPEETGEEQKTMEIDASVVKQKKKKNGKSKQRKSTDSTKHDDEITENMDKDSNSSLVYKEQTQPMEEDIESLISSNKISKAQDLNGSDISETDTVDMETALLPLDKQSELQYLLQKQNNPAQFIQAPNLTHKTKNVLKTHNASTIQKPAAQAKICDRNAKRLQKIGQAIVQKDKTKKEDESSEGEKDASALNHIKSLTDECTIESIPTCQKKTADIAVLKNKWQMSESFTQVKKNLSELSKSVDKPKKSSDSKYSNPVRRLETNPSISVRELFPGEDEMNLQCSIEFNNVKGVTPEGWEKCNASIQYDLDTKKLWHELQKPYGNQSSFLRHLVLLEKYFRTGDLILSPNASGFAANYSDSVQSRLRAYDNIPEQKKPTPAVSLIEYRKKPNPGKSLLKSNQNADGFLKLSETKLPPPPPKSSEPPAKHSKQPNFVPFPGLPPAPAVFVKPKSRSAPSTSSEMRPPSKQKSAPPPELISIHTPTPQGRKSIENVLKNIEQMVKGVTAPPEQEPTAPSHAVFPLAPAAPPPPPPQLPAPVKEKKHKQKTTTKPWRPTLMQITEENLAKIGNEQLQVAVDGRVLPSLVQVMSGGQRYHITLADYNKMCIMRREKLQQVQVINSKSKKTTEVVTEIQPSATHGNGGTLTQLTTEAQAELTAQQKSDEAASNAANIIKNVGLKNITIAPVIEKSKTTATVTSHVATAPVASSPSLLITTTPLKMPQLGSAVTITSDSPVYPGLIASPVVPQYSATIQPLAMPKIPKSLTVIPQTVPATASMGLPGSLVGLPAQLSIPPSTVVSVPVASPQP